MSKKTSIAILATLLVLSVIVNILIGYYLWDAKQPEVLATVNGQKITKDTLAERVLARNKKEQLNSFIEEMLVEQQAKEYGLEIKEDEITRRILDLKESLGGDDLYQRFLSDAKITEADLKESIRYNLYLEKIVLAQYPITDAEVLSYYEEHKEEFNTPELRLVSHIFTDNEDSIKKAYSELVRGESFASVANKYSLDPSTNKEGGRIGWMAREDDWIGVTDIAFTLKQREYSAPKQSEYGWHLVYVDEIRAGEKPQFTDIKDKVRQSYVDYIIDNVKDTVIQELKSKSKITINN